MTWFGTPSATVLFVSGYALLLLAVAWAFDRMGARSALQSARWRTDNFHYHERQDAWTCHRGQWLRPVAFDRETRVATYAGDPDVCGPCPLKAECSPSPGPREVTRKVDPWPHSEAGRFHRGIALAVAAVAFFLTLVLLVKAGNAADVAVLAVTDVVILLASYPLARHLWNTPSDGYEDVPEKAA